MFPQIVPPPVANNGTGFNMQFGNSYGAPIAPPNNFTSQIQTPTGQQYANAFNTMNSGGAVPTNPFSGMADWNAGASNNITNTIGSDTQAAFNAPPTGMNFQEGLGVANTALSGVQALGNAWLGFQQLKLGKQNLAFQKDAFNKNYANQVQTTNTSLADRQNARQAANPSAYQGTGSYMQENRVGK